jgi:hypothetical protein
MIKTKIFAGIFSILMLGAAPLMTVAGETKAYKIDFSETEKFKGKDFPKGWVLKGTKWRVPDTDFYIKSSENSAENVLVVESDKSTGAILFDVHRHVDLKKTPIMRWRWRALKLPEGADGRDSTKDDQVLSIYLGAGSIIRQSVAYRWETDTPVGAEGNTKYGGGLVKVAWFCLQNKTSPRGEWITMERNVAEDFKKLYGVVPAEFAISIGGNSQYTGTMGIGEVDFIEFVPEKSDTAIKSPQGLSFSKNKAEFALSE